MNLILEGPDGAGKTTLANHIKQAWPETIYHHHGPDKHLLSAELAAKYMVSLRPALRGADLVLDRSWLSEPIYASVYRGTASRITQEQRRMLERAALQAGMVVVRCLPSEEQCVKTFLSGREEMLDSTEQLRAVYQAYAAGLDTWLPIVDFDYTKDSLDELLKRATTARQAYKPRVVLLGDRPAVRSLEQAVFAVPFVSFTGPGCSTWLAEQLNAEGIAEHALIWFNAYGAEGRALSPSKLPVGIPVVALGNQAANWCVEHEVPCRLVPHPQAHKRFAFNEPYPLIKILKEILG